MADLTTRGFVALSLSLMVALAALTATATPETEITGYGRYVFGAPKSSFAANDLGPIVEQQDSHRSTFSKIGVPFTVGGRTYKAMRVLGFLDGRLAAVSFGFAADDPVGVAETLRATATAAYPTRAVVNRPATFVIPMPGMAPAVVFYATDRNQNVMGIAIIYEDMVGPVVLIVYDAAGWIVPGSSAPDSSL